MPVNAFNRLADHWRPLLAVAEVAGGEWSQRAAAAFATLTGGADLEAQGSSATLLADLAATFVAVCMDRLPSAKLAEALAAIEGRSWQSGAKCQSRFQRTNWQTNSNGLALFPATSKRATARC